MLLRVSEPCGRPAIAVEVDAKWLPSGVVRSGRHLTAAGLCLIPWLGDATSVELTVRTEEGSSSVVRWAALEAIAEPVHLCAPRSESVEREVA